MYLYKIIISISKFQNLFKNLEVKMLLWKCKNVKPLVLIKSFHYATGKRIKLYRLLCWFYLCNWINWIMFYLLFIHFSLGRRSLLILWNMQNKIRMKSSLSIKIGSCCIGFLSTSFRGGDLFSSCGICQKIRMKSAIWKKWIILYQLFIHFSLRKEISSHLVAWNMPKMRMKSPF